MKADSIRIHRARWVVPVSRSGIKDGAVALGYGAILAVDEFPRVRQQYPLAPVVDHPQAVLTPALVNAHIHLELSHLVALAAAPLDTSFTGWITRMLQLRDTLGAVGEQAEHAARRTIEQQYRSGVCVLADIGNTTIGRALAASFSGLLFPYREYLGLAEHTLEKNLHRLSEEAEDSFCSGHAPYSTHPRLLRRLKERATALGQVLPIHTAEPEAEGEMIRQGRGELVEFVRQRGFWDDSFVPRGSGGSIHYLRDLGLLDNRTLCVHAIHVSDEEIRIMAGEGVKVCLCPGSNQFLETGTAPARAYLDHGILPALGTDSLASNPELSLWREMRILAEAHSEVEPAEIFRMATLGGAEALGLGQRFGTLAPGRDADLLAVPVAGDLTNEDQVYRCLVQSNDLLEPVRIRE
jgi:cytosine/adenosine deaminase-related metal-dependent hydrolase